MKIKTKKEKKANGTLETTNLFWHEVSWVAAHFIRYIKCYSQEYIYTHTVQMGRRKKAVR